MDVPSSNVAPPSLLLGVLYTVQFDIAEPTYNKFLLQPFFIRGNPVLLPLPSRKEHNIVCVHCKKSSYFARKAAVLVCTFDFVAPMSIAFCTPCILVAVVSAQSSMYNMCS